MSRVICLRSKRTYVQFQHFQLFFSPQLLAGLENLHIEKYLLSAHSERKTITLAVLPGTITGLNKHNLAKNQFTAYINIFTSANVLWSPLTIHSDWYFISLNSNTSTYEGQYLIFSQKHFLGPKFFWNFILAVFWSFAWQKVVLLIDTMIHFWAQRPSIYVRHPSITHWGLILLLPLSLSLFLFSSLSFSSLDCNYSLSFSLSLSLSLSRLSHNSLFTSLEPLRQWTYFQNHSHLFPN